MCQQSAFGKQRIEPERSAEKPTLPWKPNSSAKDRGKFGQTKLPMRRCVRFVHWETRVTWFGCSIANRFTGIIEARGRSNIRQIGNGAGDSFFSATVTNAKAITAPLHRA
jgi:hypothetical protein